MMGNVLGALMTIIILIRLPLKIQYHRGESSVYLSMWAIPKLMLRDAVRVNLICKCEECVICIPEQFLAIVVLKDYL